MGPNAAPTVAIKGGGGLEGVTTAETEATVASNWKGDIRAMWEVRVKAPEGSVGVA